VALFLVNLKGVTVTIKAARVRAWKNGAGQVPRRQRV